MPPPRNTRKSKDVAPFNLCYTNLCKTKYYESSFNRGFTLAEVLITLGIIGLVAAMTMPSLIQDHRKKVTSARLKKFYNTMSQALILSENDNGPAGEWEKEGAIREDDGTLIDTPDNSIAFFKKYFAPYMKVIIIDKDEKNKAFAVFADGSTITFLNGNCVDMIFDTNGNKRPNIEGRDQYRFLFCTNKYNITYIDKNKNFGTYYQHYILTKDRNSLVNICKTNKETCATLLLNDDWEIKDDYPW